MLDTSGSEQRDILQGSIFLIGAQKAGSTYLHHLLRQAAPQLVQGRIKEMHYFTSNRYRRLALSELFPGATAGSRLIDSSTSYLHNPECAARILADAGAAAPVVAVIRDPAKRIVSAYLHRRKHGTETRSLAEVLDLEGNDYDSLRASEMARAKRAMARGRLVPRFPRPWPKELSENDYDNPLWNFGYVSNSFYWAQSAPFRAQFDHVTLVRMEDLVADPARVLQALSPRVELPLSYREAPVDENPTRYVPRFAAGKFLRNHRAAGSARPTRALSLLRGTLALYSGTDLPEDAARMIRQAPWYPALEADYAQACAAALPL